MIRKKQECAQEIREQMKGGPGRVLQTSFVNKDELLNKGRLFGNLHLEPDCGIGYHVHENETEIFYIASGEAVYNDNGEEKKVEAGDICICKPGEGHGVKTIDKACDLIAVIVLA